VTNFEAELQRKLDAKTKPPGALGRVERLAAQVARITGSLSPVMERCRLTIFAADHGLAEAGVSAYPQAVTRQMLANFLAGGAAANVFARALGVSVRVVDAGVAGEPLDLLGLLSRRLGAGSANALHGPAMTADQVEAALRIGQTLGADAECDAVMFGEMGIANSSSAALLTHAFTGEPIERVTGPGTGLDEAGLSHKRAVLQAVARRAGGGLSPLDALREFGGFEIVMMAGAFLGAAERRRPAVVDGFIATAAAMAAVQLQPSVRTCLIFAHRSSEPGHAVLLQALEAEPLLDLDLRLGEGTGALLAWPLVKAAAAMLRDMASFDSAGVSARVAAP